MVGGVIAIGRTVGQGKVVVMVVVITQICNTELASTAVVMLVVGSKNISYEIGAVVSVGCCSSGTMDDSDYDKKEIYDRGGVARGSGGLGKGQGKSGNYGGGGGGLSRILCILVKVWMFGEDEEDWLVDGV